MESTLLARRGVFPRIITARIAGNDAARRLPLPRGSVARPRRRRLAGQSIGDWIIGGREAFSRVRLPSRHIRFTLAARSVHGRDGARMTTGASCGAAWNRCPYAPMLTHSLHHPSHRSSVSCAERPDTSHADGSMPLPSHASDLADPDRHSQSVFHSLEAHFNIIMFPCSNFFLMKNVCFLN